VYSSTGHPLPPCSRGTPGNPNRCLSEQTQQEVRRVSRWSSIQTSVIMISNPSPRTSLPKSLLKPQIWRLRLQVPRPIFNFTSDLVMQVAATGFLLAKIEPRVNGRCGLLNRPTGSGGDRVWRIEESAAGPGDVTRFPQWVWTCRRRIRFKFRSIYILKRVQGD